MLQAKLPSGNGISRQSRTQPPEVIRAIMLDGSPYVLHEQSTHLLAAAGQAPKREWDIPAVDCRVPTERLGRGHQGPSLQEAGPVQEPWPEDRPPCSRRRCCCCRCCRCGPAVVADRRPRTRRSPVAGRRRTRGRLEPSAAESDRVRHAEGKAVSWASRRTPSSSPPPFRDQFLKTRPHRGAEDTADSPEGSESSRSSFGSSPSTCVWQSLEEKVTVSEQENLPFLAVLHAIVLWLFALCLAIPA